MPPMVAREAVETSTGNHSPCFLSWRLRSSSTMPGSTTQVRFSTSSERMRFRCLEKSTTIPVVDGLAALRGAAAARGDDPALVAGDRKRPQRLVHGPGNHHAERHDLVERGVGRVAAAVEGVEENVARNLAGEARGKGAVFRRILWFFGPCCRHYLVLLDVRQCLACRGPAWQGKALLLMH